MLGALALLVILAMLLERALPIIFEWSVLRDWLKEKLLRVPIALVASYVIGVWGEFAKAGDITGHSRLQKFPFPVRTSPPDAAPGRRADYAA